MGFYKNTCYQAIDHPKDLKVTWHGNLNAEQAKYLQGIANQFGSRRDVS